MHNQPSNSLAEEERERKNNIQRNKRFRYVTRFVEKL